MRRRARRGALIGATCSLLTVLCLAAPAAGETVEEARRLYFEADFRSAEQAFTAALEGGELEAGSAASAHVHLAALALMFDDEEGARHHAERAAALDPGIAAPEGAPRQLDEMLAHFVEANGGRPVSLDLELEPQGRVVMTMVPPLRLLAAELSLRCEAPGAEPASVSGAPPRVELTSPVETGALRCAGEARNSAGAVLLHASSTLDLGTIEPEVGLGRRLLWLWIGLGVVVVGATALALALALPSDEVLLTETRIEGW